MVDRLVDESLDKRAPSLYIHLGGTRVAHEFRSAKLKLYGAEVTSLRLLTKRRWLKIRDDAIGMILLQYTPPTGIAQSSRAAIFSIER